MIVPLLLALGVSLAGADAQPSAQVAAPPSPPALTLAAAVERARTSSPFTQPARSLAEGTSRAAELAGRPLNPLFEFRTENWGPGRSQLPLDIFATLSQTWELGGKRAARLGVATADRDLAGANVELAHQQIAVRTAVLYVQALRARGVLESLRTNRDALSTLIASVRRRVDEGLSAESDLLRFETEAARVDIDIARAGVELARSLGSLSAAIGATSPLAPSQLIEPVPMAPPVVDSARLAAAVAAHPEVRSADARVTRARQQTALERARRLPDSMITGGYKRTAGFDSSVVAVTMSVPLFDRNGAATARASGEESAAMAERDAIAMRLTAEVGALIEAARVLAARAGRAQTDLLQPADAVRAAALATFREGTADVLKLIDAERVYADVRRAALELRLEALAAALEARFALGEESIP
jgi:cobalt-zinc-cadmium efflux system outer membrane protein